MNRRNRTDTEMELIVINYNQNNYEEIYSNKCLKRINRGLQNTYVWNTLMCSTFLCVRLLSALYFKHNITVEEWYSDSITFLMSNHYLFKRIHWNNNHDITFYYNKNVLNICIFFLSLTIFTVLSRVLPAFYITKNSIYEFNFNETILFYFLCCYVILNQVITFYYISYLEKDNIILKHIIKYCLLAIFIFMNDILSELEITKYDINSDYHIHHWLSSLFLIFITEFKQPYHTIFQYIHYGVYLNGVACYGYDTLLN